MKNIFKQFYLREWIYTVLILVLIIIQVILDLRIPEYMQEIIIAIQSSSNLSGDLFTYGTYMVLATLGSVLAAVGVGYFIANIAATTSKRLRSDIFSNTMHFSKKELNKFSTASLITRSTNDVTQIQMIVAMGMQFLIKAPILATWAIVKIVDKNIEWSLAVAVAVGILMLMLGIIVVVALPKFKKVQELTDQLNRTARSKITGLRVVRAFNADEYENRKFDDANNELTNTNLFTMRLMAIMQPTISFVMGGVSVAIYWIGASLIDSASSLNDKMLTFSDMIVFSSYATLIISSFMLLTMTFILLPRATISAKRINEVIETKNEIKDGSYSVEQIESIEFKGVTFGYFDGAENTLTDISFEARKGETVAIIGSTGAGKSTLLNLIPRFYDISIGEILINGVSTKKYNLNSLNSKISFTPQKSILFNGSIKQNITFFKDDVDEERLESAINISQSKEFISKLDDGVNSYISQGGKNISGGQKQRLSIARSIYKEADVLIFDDTFSALDYKTEQKLRSELKTITKDKIIIIVAQRVSTIQHVDKIIVLDQGEIVGIGNHRSLLNSNSVYKEIVLSQLSEEELSYA